MIKVLILFFHFLSILLNRDSKVHKSASSLPFFLLIIKRFGRQVQIRLSICMSKYHWSLCVSFSRTYTGLCIYHLFVWSNLNFLHNSQWITLPTQSCLVLYSFCANLLHSFIMWLLVLSLLPHYIHLLFCCVLSILSLILLVLMSLFCAAMRRNSISLLGFPFFSYVQFFFYTRFSCCFFPKVWVIAGLSSSGLFLVFKQIYGLVGYDSSSDL